MDPEVITQDRNARLPKHKILKLPELSENPFRYRIAKVFSSTNNGCMTYEDFINMLSVFSERAPKSVKVEYAFQIYDFNEDGQICPRDIRNIIAALCGHSHLPREYMDQMIGEIFAECDLDEDQVLDFKEFEQIISKNPDFLDSFRFRV